MQCIMVKFYLLIILSDDRKKKIPGTHCPCSINVNQWLFYVIEAVSGINMKTEVLITCICIKPTFSTNNSGSISIVMYYIDSL